jgi:hypothetical protein
MSLSTCLSVADLSELSLMALSLMDDIIKAGQWAKANQASL